MKLNRHNISDRKLIAFELYNAGETPAGVSKRLGVTEATTCSWYAQWLSYFHFEGEAAVTLKTEPCHYWETEEELEQSFNLEYDYQSLSREEKAIYKGL